MPKLPIIQHPDLSRLTPEQIIIAHTNSRQEWSPGLLHALEITGPKPSINRIPDVVLKHYNSEGTPALLIVGLKNRVVWCGAGKLSAITSLAQLYEASHAMNWEGCVDLNLPTSVQFQLGNE